MFDVFGSVKGFLKIEDVCIDNNLFRLHYKVTVMILIGFSLIVTSRQYIGDPIECMVDEIPPDVMNAYCWIHSTYTVTNVTVKNGGAHDGVGPHGKYDQKKIHHYYQWVCFCLFFQAMLFYLPRYLWKSWEGGLLRMLAKDLNGPMIDEGLKRDRKQLLIRHLLENFNAQNAYAYKFFVCELLNFANALTQIYLMDWFLGGEFSSYGLDVVRFTEREQEDRIDPMTLVFPKITKCVFRKYGPSGEPQNFDGLCVLPLNVVNEKIYVFLWFWFLLVGIASGLGLIYRVVVLTGSNFRLTLLRTKARFCASSAVRGVAKGCLIGDWFVLYQLGKNIEATIYGQLIGELALAIEGKETV